MLHNLSNNELAFINCALNEALKSPVLMRHGAVAVAHGKVLGRGYNHYRSYSQDNFISNTCTCHAEIASLRNMFHCYKKHNANSIKGPYAWSNKRIRKY